MINRTEAAAQAIGAFIETMTKARALVVAGSLTPELYGRLMQAEDLLDVVDERLLRLRPARVGSSAAPALRQQLKQVCADTRTLARP